MKKLFFFTAALFASAAMMAETITILPTEFTTAYSAEAKTITVDGVEFSFVNIKGNAKNTPSGVLGKQFIQLKAAEALLTNTTAVEDLTTVKLYAKQEFANYKIVFGTSTDTIFSGDLTPTTEAITYKDADEQPVDATAYIYTFTNPNSAAYFTLTNGKGNGQYLYKIVIDCSNTPQAVENIQATTIANKQMVNGQLVIIRDGIRYNAIGQQL